jgi:pyrroline-5-carboxylate reductase
MFCLLHPLQIHILDKDRLKVDLVNNFNLGIPYDQPGDFIRDMDLVILAVKPQDTSELFGQVRPYMKPDHLVITIMAGISMADIASGKTEQALRKNIPTPEDLNPNRRFIDNLLISQLF